MRGQLIITEHRFFGGQDVPVDKIFFKVGLVFVS